MRAITTFVAEKLGLKKGRRENQQNEPWWKRRIERDINETRKHISIMDRERKGELRSRRKYLEIEKKYQVDRKGLLVVIEELKQRLTAKAAKIRRYEQRIQQYKQNRLFSTDQKRFYQELDGGITYDRTVPDAEECLGFWSNIWDNSDQHHNNEAEWLRNLKEEKHKAGRKQENVGITAEQVTKQCRKMPNWKAPGPDGVQGFWLKKITSCHERIAIQLNSLLNKEATLPLWMTLGKIILCQKDPAKGNEASNFRPISCLPLMWKLMTSIMADSMYAYLDENSL
eukprot:gene828-biopygen97